MDVDIEYGAPYLEPSFEAYHKDFSDDRDALDEFQEAFETFMRQASTKDAKVQTHTNLAGGKYALPIGSKESQFWKLYAQYLRMGFKRSRLMHISETVIESPVFRFYVDLDMAQSQKVPRYQIEAYAACCAKVVARFWPEQESTCIVSWSPWSQEKGKIKTGVHLHWPHIYATKAQALDVRESLLAALVEAFGLREPPSNAWEDVVDKSVYSSGLRPIGSWKTGCKNCSSKGCDLCTKRTSWVVPKDLAGHDGRPYYLLCVLKWPSADGRLDRDLDSEAAYLADFLRLLWDTKLRTDRLAVEAETGLFGYKRPEGAPTYAVKDKTGPKNAKAPAGRVVESTDPAYRECQAVIRRAFGDLYKDVVVRKVKSTSQRVVVDVMGLNSRYCQNVAREHRSNNIYFVISKEGICQRCYDGGPASAETRHGPCSGYSSATMVIEASLLRLLWPEQQSDAASTFQAQDDADDVYSTFEMEALLNGIEYLHKKIYNASWMNAVGLQASRGPHGLHDFMPTDPKAKEAAVFKDLGLAWADNMVRPIEGHSQTVPRPGVSLARLDQDLMEAFDTIVLLAAATTDPTVFERCLVLDDFLSPGDLASQTGEERPSKRRKVGTDSGDCASNLMIVDED